MDGTLLLQGAASISVVMAGAGLFRLMSSGSESIKRIPEALERSAVAHEASAKTHERAAVALEGQNVALTQVADLRQMFLKTSQDIEQLVAGREEIGRALRIMSRKIEALGPDDQEETKG